nr:MaoC/PaaZ C-terminal domain-containing protein [Tamaricihabitans halophyticus]
MDELEGSFIAKQAMNTAQGHWNEHSPNPLVSGRLVFGLATASLVLGLSAQDTMEHAVSELSYGRFRFLAPVQHMDTVRAYSEVLDKRAHPERADAGVVVFKHYGVRQDEVVVFEGERTGLIKKHAHWSEF